MGSSCTFLRPSIIFEVVSDDGESYPLRVLLEAIVAQAGKYLTGESPESVVRLGGLSRGKLGRRKICSCQCWIENSVLFCSSSRFCFLAERSGFQCYRLLNCTTNVSATGDYYPRGPSNFQLWISRVSLSATSICVALSREPLLTKEACAPGCLRSRGAKSIPCSRTLRSY